MAVINITIESLGEELISGIPEFVKITTNIPSTIYYTLDKSTPSLNSKIYIEPIKLPTDVSINLKVIAISGLDSGFLDVVYSTNISELYRSRRVDGWGEGLVVDEYGVVPVLYDGYTIDDQFIVDVPTRYSDYELQDLDIKYSRTGPSGEGKGTIIENGPITPDPNSIYMKADTPNNNVFFNPRSLYVTIDGRDGYQNQSVFIINKPFMCTTNLSKYLQGKALYEPTQPITGGKIRTFYSIRDGYGIACSYYFDNFETRWVKSIQRFDPSIVPTNIGDRRQVGNPLVFKWIYNKRSAI